MNWRTASDLQAFLESIDRHPPAYPYSVTIENVDPTHPDVLVAETWIASHHAANRSGVHVAVADNVGYGRACNHGGSLGDYRYIAFFNADVEVTEGSLNDIVTAMELSPDWSIVGPRQVDAKGRLTHAGIFGTLDQPSMGDRFRARDRGQADQIRTDAVTVSGSAYFIRREVWDELNACLISGVVDPGSEGAFLQTPHYYEETWCSYHAQAHGHKVVYFGPVVMIHHWHRASPVGGRAEKLLPESRKLFRDACDAHGIPHD